MLVNRTKERLTSSACRTPTFEPDNETLVDFVVAERMVDVLEIEFPRLVRHLALLGQLEQDLHAFLAAQSHDSYAALLVGS